MLKHFAIMAAAISVGLALGKMFGGTGLTSLFSGTTTTTSTSCYLAAAVFGEDFETGPRTALVRRWLFETWIHSGVLARVVLAAYRRHGRALGATALRYRFVRRACTPVFNHALARARAKYTA